MRLHLPRAPRRAAIATAVLSVACAAAFAAPAADAASKPGKVKVMTRNLYLGADLTKGVEATDAQGLVDAAGGIFNAVDANNFGIRAKGLASEIRKQNPDLVGLQEAALWRTEPCTQTPVPPKATTVRWDYLKLLLAQLNKGKKRYRAVVTKPEFDFEIWANTDNNRATSAPGCPFGSEINGRLTMRDVILARTGVKTSHPKSGTFKTLLQARPAGAPTNVTRGWTAVDAQVGSKKVHFVNAHLESFDNNRAANHRNNGPDVGNGQIRQAQAKELVARGGPVKSKLPVILVGDLNSDIKTEVKPGDSLAYRAVRGGGFVERSTSRPLGCCLDAEVLTTSGGGKRSDFNHQVDHILTNKPKKVKLIQSVVTGLSPVNGFWDSDHAGLTSLLLVK